MIFHVVTGNNVASFCLSIHGCAFCVFPLYVHDTVGTRRKRITKKRDVEEVYGCGATHVEKAGSTEDHGAMDIISIRLRCTLYRTLDLV